MNCDKDMISNLDAINNDDIVRKENGSSSRIDARNHIRSIFKKRCLEWKKRSCPKLRNAEIRKACLAKTKEIMRMRRQQYSSSLSMTDKKLMIALRDVLMAINTMVKSHWIVIT